MSAETLDLLSVIDLHSPGRVLTARDQTRELAGRLGYDTAAQAEIATAVAELAGNAQRWAIRGRVRISLSAETASLVIEVDDEGPGIADLDTALAGGGGGHGLTVVPRLMDVFTINSDPRGTRVRTTRRLPANGPWPDAGALRIALGRAPVPSPLEAAIAQNRELLNTMAQLRDTEEQLAALKRELEDTNRGVVALYAELDDRAEQLRDADAAKTRFLADMSHELRSPLNSIIGLTELLLAGPDPLSSEQAMQVGYIRRMGHDQLALVGELLDIAKIEAGRVDITLAPLDLAELFGSLRIQMTPLVSGSAVEMRFHTEPGLRTLVTDEQKLIQILRNLITNAVKYTRQGEIVVRAARVENRLELTVDDTGIGIPADALDRIFDEFVQVAGEHQRHVAGTGLGLALTRKLAGLLGGSVNVTSTVGEGSRFCVSLPWLEVADASATISPVRNDGHDGLPHLELVLVVDDDPHVRHLVRRQLEAVPGIGEIAEVDGGVAALGFLDRRRPNVIVLDLGLPDLDGFAVLETLRGRPGSADLPVVIHTSRELTKVEAAQLAAGRATVVAKGGAWTSRLVPEVLAAAAEGAHRG